MKSSAVLFERAKKVLVGGVNSPVRAFRSVGGEPVIFASGSGCHITDVDGRSYIDYVGSWGPLILGHADPEITKGLCEAAAKGTSFGATSEIEIALAERIRDFVPSMERVRMVNSGTEATMSAIRVARGFTGRDKIIKFEGCYHGHGDSFLIKAGSGATTLGIPDSLGVPVGVASDTLTAAFNDLDAVERILLSFADQIAAVILEPVAGNMGVVAPKPGFLEGLRTICSEHGILLIFDEVMTGFRVAPGGAQELYGVKPDLTTLGKIIGGGLPVGAYGGRADIMENVSPSGPVYQAGTLSGNPLAATAGFLTLGRLMDRSVYETLERSSALLAEGLLSVAGESGIPVVVNRVGSMLTLFFTEHPVEDYDSAKKSDTARFAKYFREMLSDGVFLPPSQFEALFVSLAHSGADIDRTISAARKAISLL